MRTIARDLLGVAACWAAATGTAAGEAYEYTMLGRINADGVRVRKEPTSDSPTVKQLNKGTEVHAIGYDGEWRHLSAPVSGWVHSQHIDPGVWRYTSEQCKVWNLPGKEGGVTAELKKGVRVKVRSVHNSWRLVIDPVTGWVHEDNLGKNKPEPDLGPASSAGFVRLPSSATGLYWYCPYSTHHWGVPRLINQTITMGRRWAPRRIACGDISLPNGGYFPPHSTHRDGRAEDFLPMTTSGSGGSTSVGYSSYSTYWNQKFVNLMYATGSITYILHNNSRISGVQYSSGHHNHLHMYVR